MKLANRVKTAAESATESEKDGASFCVNSMICTAQIFLTTILAPRGEREKREREEREREREREIFLMTRETERLCPGQPRHRGGWDPFLSIAAMGTVTPLYSTTHPPLPLLTHTAGRRLRACAPRAATTVLAALTAPGLPREKFEFRSALQ